MECCLYWWTPAATQPSLVENCADIRASLTLAWSRHQEVGAGEEIATRQCAANLLASRRATPPGQTPLPG
eukprot:4215096-Pyramimonas_sp.AAC.1